MSVDLHLPAFSVIALCHVHFSVTWPSGSPCELLYAGGPTGLERDVRAYLIGKETASTGEEVAVLLGFLTPDAHRHRLSRGLRIELRRGELLVAQGEMVACTSRD